MEDNIMESREQETTLMKRCSHFISCSAVDCPLDPLQGERGPVEEEECRVRRSTRLRVTEQARAEGVTTPLKYDGLTYREWKREQRSSAGRARWQALAEEEKQIIRQRLAKAREKVAA